jgi:putative transcriptional regulator
LHNPPNSLHLSAKKKTAHMPVQSKVKNGTLLLAQPFMEDPYFEGAVVLVCDVDATLGFILNKPLDIKLGDLVPDLKGCEFPIYYGGPVEANTLNFVHRHGGLIAKSEAVMRGLWMGGNFDDVVFLISQGLIESHDILFFIGYTGWSPEQLTEEINERSWILASPDLNYMFNVDDPALLWHEIMHDMGGHYQVLAAMPFEMTWN